MYNNTANWYTDLFSVYRNTINEKMGVITTERKLISKDNRCRIYRKSKPSLSPSPQAAELSISDSMICDINIDIEAGDEIRVIRGYFINRNKEEKANIYIAGLAVDYYTPIGAANPDIQHKEVPLQNTLRAGAYLEEDV